MAKFKENGKLKLLIIVGTRPEILKLLKPLKPFKPSCSCGQSELTINKLTF